MARRFDRVAVVGAGIGGLLAARVLADHAREVVLIERDRVRDHPVVPRKGVPQGHHAHSILTAGQRAIERLCPGITRALVEHGAVFGGGSFFSAGGYLHAPAAGASLFASRPLLESELRRCVLARPQVRLLDGHAAQPPVLEAGRIVGVRAAALDADAGEPLQIGADLVVDASGRASRTPAWLAASGHGAPPIERVEVGMRYASRLLRRSAGDLDARCFLAVSPTAALPRACGVLAQENGRWIVTLIGYFGDRPGSDDAAFAAFARSLPAPEVAALVAHAEPLSEIRTHAFASNLRVHYERAASLPQGLIVIGDALASFSPVYGQGMSVAALQACALHDCLRADSASGFERSYVRAAARVIDAPWSITVGNDRQLAPGGPHGSRMQRWRHRWVQRVIRAGQRDPVVAAAFFRVTRLIEKPSSLVKPSIVLRVVAIA